LKRSSDRAEATWTGKDTDHHPYLSTRNAIRLKALAPKEGSGALQLIITYANLFFIERGVSFSEILDSFCNIVPVNEFGIPLAIAGLAKKTPRTKEKLEDRPMRRGLCHGSTARSI